MPCFRTNKELTLVSFSTACFNISWTVNASKSVPYSDCRKKIKRLDDYCISQNLNYTVKISAKFACNDMPNIYASPTVIISGNRYLGRTRYNHIKQKEKKLLPLEM